MIARAPGRSRLDQLLPWISTAVRLTLAGILLAAGGLKVIDPQSSVAAVRGYQLLPAVLETPVGWGLPFLEIALGLLLVTGIATRAVAGATAVLFAVFVAAVASAAARGLSIDCGCFGGGGTVAPGQTAYTGEIVRDLAFLALASWLVWHPQTLFALDQRLEPSS